MTVIHDEFGCDETFVTARTIDAGDEIRCPICGHEGRVMMYTKGFFKGEGFM